MQIPGSNAFLVTMDLKLNSELLVNFCDFCEEQVMPNS